MQEFLKSSINQKVLPDTMQASGLSEEFLSINWIEVVILGIIFPIVILGINLLISWILDKPKIKFFYKKQLSDADLIVSVRRGTIKLEHLHILWGDKKLKEIPSRFYSVINSKDSPIEIPINNILSEIEEQYGITPDNVRSNPGEELRRKILKDKNEENIDNVNINTKLKSIFLEDNHEGKKKLKNRDLKKVKNRLIALIKYKIDNSIYEKRDKRLFPDLFSNE